MRWFTTAVWVVGQASVVGGACLDAVLKRAHAGEDAGVDSSLLPVPASMTREEAHDKRQYLPQNTAEGIVPGYTHLMQQAQGIHLFVCVSQTGHSGHSMSHVPFDRVPHLLGQRPHVSGGDGLLNRRRLVALPRPHASAPVG